MTPTLLLAGLVACEPAPATDDSGDTAPDSPLREVVTDANANANGIHVLHVEVLEGETAFQVTARGTGSHVTAFDSLKNPRGNVVLAFEDLVRDPRQITGAWVAQRQATAFNWPVRVEDGPLQPGTWKVSFYSLSENRLPDAGSRLQFTTAFKADDAPREGEIHVRILYARGIGDMPKITNAIEDAVEHWREIWARDGITLVERYGTSDLDPNLKFYREGSAEAEAASEGKEVGELQLVVGETIDFDRYIYGVSSGIPGTVQITQSSYVVLSWVTHAGRDAKFDDGEIGLMGETMAHEIGHYSGLFHTVEGYTYDRFDALDDTPECASFGTCEAATGTNLMFPYSLCDLSGCTPQTQITPDQAGVLHTFVAAL